MDSNGLMIHCNVLEYSLMVVIDIVELPWDQPHVEYPEYRSWIQNNSDLPPFNKTDVLSLCKSPTG